MNSNVHVNNISLAYAAALVLIALLISKREKLGLERSMIVSVIRAVVQLTIVGYILKYIFALNNIIVTAAMILIIIFNAARNAEDRGKGIPGLFWPSFLAILTSTAITLSGLVLSGAVKFIPSQMIPISGMIASNSMVAVGLCYKQMKTKFHDERQQLEERLALGATPFQSCSGIDPVYAIKYQIMVVFMLLAATSLASVSSSYMACRRFFNDECQIVVR